MKGAIVMDGVRPAERGRENVIDLPAILALRSIVRPENQCPVGVDAILGLREALDRATCRPSGELIAFVLREVK